MRRSSLLLLLSLLLPTSGWARLEGQGRVSLMPGWRLTPNEYFYGSAQLAGHPVTTPSRGGPMGVGSFAYGASEIWEVAIDLFAGTETLRLDGLEPISSVSYGALIGARWQTALLWEDLTFTVGLLTGPTLVLVDSRAFSRPIERLTTAYGGNAGLCLRLAGSWGLSLEYRLLFARGVVPSIGGVNGGGHWLSLGVTYFFAPSESSPGPSTRF